MDKPWENELIQSVENTIRAHIEDMPCRIDPDAIDMCTDESGHLLIYHEYDFGNHGRLKFPHVVRNQIDKLMDDKLPEDIRNGIEMLKALKGELNECRKLVDLAITELQNKFI